MTDMDLQYPWAFLLLPLIPAVIYGRRHYVHRVGFSAVSFIGVGLGPNLIKKYGMEVLGILFMLSSIFALANLRYSTFWQKSYLESKWIMIVQDLSGSMNRQGGEGEQVT
jgi:hypothetical protein